MALGPHDFPFDWILILCGHYPHETGDKIVTGSRLINGETDRSSNVLFRDKRIFIIASRGVPLTTRMYSFALTNFWECADKKKGQSVFSSSYVSNSFRMYVTSVGRMDLQIGRGQQEILRWLNLLADRTRNKFMMLMDNVFCGFANRAATRGKCANRHTLVKRS